jgi:hypothetical protein
MRGLRLGFGIVLGGTNGPPQAAWIIDGPSIVSSPTVNQPVVSGTSIIG